MSTIVDKNDDEQKTSPIGDEIEFESSDPENDLQPEFSLPRNEAQARPLSKLTPEQQVDAWSLVLDWVNGGARLTSYLVGQAAHFVSLHHAQLFGHVQGKHVFDAGTPG